MESKQLIFYQTLYSEFNLNKRNLLVDKIKNYQRETDSCYGSDNYIKSYIRDLKEKVIRKLPELNKVIIELAIFDKENIYHQIVVNVCNMVLTLLQINEKLTFRKSVYVCIKYENNIVHVSALSFEGIL